MEVASNVVAARAFVRSLNILLKTVRLYGVEHERTTALLNTAWDELSSALKSSGQAGLLLGVSENQILLDGAPLDKHPSDRSFAQLLTGAGLASINFTPQAKLEDLHRLISGFASASPRSKRLAQELKILLGGDKGAIRVNEIRFVAQDATGSGTGAAAILAARSLGAEGQKLQSLLEQPERLLQLIAAAEGTRNQPSGPAPGLPSPVPSGARPQEEDVSKVLQWLTHVGQVSRQPASGEAVQALQNDVRALPPGAQASLAQAMASLSSQQPMSAPSEMLLELAERVAVQFALDRYNRGDVRTNAVMDLLDRFKREIGSLRDIIKGHEEKLSRAGVEVESHAELLDRQFWARVPGPAKQKMLLSPEAWAVPPRNVRQFVEELLDCDDAPAARAILDNYAGRLQSADPEARRKASAGLTELADLYSRVNHSLLKSTLHQMGEALCQEGHPEVQSLLGASFVRLSHEAAAKRQYPAVEQAFATLDMLQQRQPALAHVLWPRVKVGNPLPDFIEEGLTAPHLPAGLAEVLRRMPQATVDQVATRSRRCTRRDEWSRLLEMAEAVGAEGIEHLRKILQTSPAQEAASKVALLSRLGPRELENLLPEKLRVWDAATHDMVVRQLAGSLAPERSVLLDKVYELLDRNVLPCVVDEMGMAGDPTVSSRLIRIVEEKFPSQSHSYLQVKAIEALGRLRTAKAASLLRPLAESRRYWSWTHPRELRITAAQALRKIDPDWANDFLPRSGLSEEDLSLAPLDPDPNSPWLRQRRYTRVNLPRPIEAAISSGIGRHGIALRQLSLGGGVGACQCHLKQGTAVPLECKSRFRRLQARVLVREARPHELTFEIAQMSMEDRHRWRSPLASAVRQAPSHIRPAV